MTMEGLIAMGRLMFDHQGSWWGEDFHYISPALEIMMNVVSEVGKSYLYIELGCVLNTLNVHCYLLY